MSAVQETDVVVGTNPTGLDADTERPVPAERKPKRKSSFREASAYPEDDSLSAPTLERRPSSSRISFRDEHGGDVEEVSLLCHALQAAHTRFAKSHTYLNPTLRLRLRCATHTPQTTVNWPFLSDTLRTSFTTIAAVIIIDPLRVDVA